MSKPRDHYPTYYKTVTPCGKPINQNYKEGSKIESCATVCPDKNFTEIDKCYDLHKANKPDPLSRYGQNFVNVNSKERLFSH